MRPSGSDGTSVENFFKSANARCRSLFCSHGGDGIIYAVNPQGRNGTGDVNSPSVIELGGWPAMKHLVGGDRASSTRLSLDRLTCAMLRHASWIEAGAERGRASCGCRATG